MSKLINMNTKTITIEGKLYKLVPIEEEVDLTLFSTIESGDVELSILLKEDGTIWKDTISLRHRLNELDIIDNPTFLNVLYKDHNSPEWEDLEDYKEVILALISKAKELEWM
jgi:hypothetical protein